MTAKPVLGYASRTDAVISMRSQGLTTRQIGERLCIADNTVTALEHSSGRSKRRAARPAEEMGRTVLFPRDILDQLGPHAARRGIHPNSLARLIVATVVDEGMIDAVLDDQEDLLDG